MDNAFIVGYGFVGKGTALSLDIPWHFSRTEANITLAEASKKKYCFICLPTPTDPNGEQTEARKVIHDYIEQLSQMNKGMIFIIRSTVLPGTCRALSEEFGVQVASNPEFLSEETWKKDATRPRVIVIGADSLPVKLALEKLWEKVPCKIRISTDTVTSETFKYAFNSFMVTKIGWSNAIEKVCEVNGANYEVIREGMMKHPWGSKHHFRVLHKGGRGAGGHCFPKDIKAFTNYSNSPFFKAIRDYNQELLSESGKQ